MIDADVIESTTRGTSGQKGPTRADIAQLPVAQGHTPSGDLRSLRGDVS
jgi:hypothetical protein